ncbi:MAG: hypothetical protein K2G42_06855 [Clostridia bacterium]|nr:hypothetical protein [Clostridia bacterium]
MAKEKKSKGAPANHTGRPTGSYSNYATSGYGYGASNGGAYGRSSYGAYGANAQQAHAANGGGNSGTKVEKVDLPDKANMTRKQKKLAKKNKKFDETDLRCYPMTVGGWIGTFILLALPLVGGICAICWFFGVGNKSRTAWIRSYVVIMILIVLVLGIILGSGYAVMSGKAKAEGLEGINGTLYYMACEVVDMFAGVIGDEEAVAAIKEQIAVMLGLKDSEESAPEDGSGNSGMAGNSGMVGDYENDEDFEFQYA